jgi:FKBP-type peptidyl-prolyl cis-trans isomerase
MRSLSVILLIIAGLFVVSCNNNRPAGYVATSKRGEKESAGKSLEKVNRYLVNAENKEIDSYIKRHKWNMKSTGSGLRYEIYKKGNGPAIKKGNTVYLNYKEYLINGVLIYTSDKKGPKVFKAGRGGVESGLEEAVLLLGKGDKAHLILPSHLAFGLNGDGDKVPRRATVIYDIEVIDVK